MQAIAAAAVSLLCAGIGSAQTISVEELAHHVPSSAMREYRASSRALSHGDVAESIAHCRKAIESDPDNATAYNDLGALYLSDGRAEDALAEFRHALVLEPRMIIALVNASFASLALGHAPDAERFARAAVEINRSDRHANLLLGWSLVAQARYSSAALESLQIAAREFPAARVAAADVLMHQGSFDSARAEVEAYLASGSTEYKSLAEAWLRLLAFQ